MADSEGKTTVTAEDLSPSDISELLGLAVGWEDEELFEICGRALLGDKEARSDAAGALVEARWHLENP